MKHRIWSSTIPTLAVGLITLSSVAVAQRPAPPPLTTGCGGSSSVSCGNTLPQYAVTEIGADLRGGDVTLTESGHLKYATFDTYPTKKLYEWSPATGLQLVGTENSPRVEQTPYGLAEVLHTNSAGEWVGSVGSPSNVLVVDTASSGVALIPARADPTKAPSTTLPFMHAYDISDQGAVVGYAELPSIYLEAEGMTYYDPQEEGIPTQYYRSGSAPFVWTPNGGTTIIPSLLETYSSTGGGMETAATFSVAYAVNNRGQVVGSDALSSFYGVSGFDPAGSAFIWTEAEGTRSLGRLAGHFASTAYDINDGGVAVGKSVGAPYSQEADGFVWTEAGGMFALDDLLTEADKARGVKISSATQINEAGQILANAYGDGGLRYVLLTPVPEPATLGLMLAGLLSVGAVARRSSCQARMT